MKTLKQNEWREINIQAAQDNFYHYCTLMFPDFYLYHGYINNDKVTYPDHDYELPGLSDQEKVILSTYKNFDNLSEFIESTGTPLSKPFRRLIKIKYKFFAALRKKYLFTLCNVLQAFYEKRLVNPKGKAYKKLMVNMPPRAKKTITLMLFVSWILGKNQKWKTFAVSYNRDLSVKFGKNVRNLIETKSINSKIITYHDIFPDTQIKRGDAAKESWSLEGQHFTFLSTSPGSTQTGIGFNIALIDDIIKNALHYYNANQVENDWEYLVNTLLSRKENSSASIVVIMHRWGADDICGRFLDKEGDQWAVIRFPAYDKENDVMLDPEVMTKEDYLNRKTLTNPDIFSANYLQEVIALEGYLYAPFKTYIKKYLPEKFEFIGFYEDTADQGTDYLACGFFGFFDGFCYILDIIYTQLGAEVTELETCDKIIELKATTGMIESNSGGHAYARNVRRIIEERKYYICTVNEFTQSGNKEARILTNRTNVTNSIIMPADWEARWPEFYKHVTRAKVKAKWEFDDAMDMLTGIYEKYVDYTPVRFI